jgi:NADH dehydrogenase FAD-containing subunit
MSAPVVEAGLTDESGWVPVSPSTMQTKHRLVYAVGDVGSVFTPSGFVPFLPKAETFALGQAEAAASNIAARIVGGKGKEFDGGGECYFMTGGGQAGFVKGNWYSTPKPMITFSPPSEQLYRGRLQFEKMMLGLPA